MRPARIIAVAFAAAVAVTGCAARSTATNPPVTPEVDAPAPPAPSPRPKPTPVPAPAPTPKPPVLADGRYESYVRRVEVPYEGGTRRLVVDLVQVFKYPVSVDAVIVDGLARSQAQVLDVWVRNQNPRLRTLPLASDLRIDLLPGDCIESRNHQWAKLVKDARVMNGSRPAYYFTVTVTGGAVHHIVEHRTGNAC